MSDASDIEELLRKAAHDLAHQRRTGWVKGVALLVSAFAGAGWTARGFLSQLPTKDDLSSLERQYAAAYETVRAHDQKQDERISTLEPRCNDALQCCVRTGERLDRITTPRAFTR